MSAPLTENSRIRVRPMEEADLPEAGRILRLAFGTFLGAPDPSSIFPGRELVATRWRATPEGAFAAEYEGRLIATNFVTRWGTFGFFGPLTVLPEFWNRKAAQALLEAAMALFEAWGVAHRGLFTFPNSPKHLHLYEKYGFRAGHLTPVFEKTVDAPPDTAFKRLSSLARNARTESIEACRELTGGILEGLDVTSEILAVMDQELGDVCLIHEGSTLTGFAVCHVGRGTEAGDHACFVKFGAVRPSSGAGAHFTQLLASCESLAAKAGVERLSLGVNMARRKAYELLQHLGYRTEIIGVAMETHPERSYNREDVYVVDDWR